MLAGMATTYPLNARITALSAWRRHPQFGSNWTNVPINWSFTIDGAHGRVSMPDVRCAYTMKKVLPRELTFDGRSEADVYRKMKRWYESVAVRDLRLADENYRFTKEWPTPSRTNGRRRVARTRR